LPAFDIIYNYPFPKFWRKEFWNTLKEIKNIVIPEKLGNHSNIEQLT
jgi:hypothetical protein